jgi:hypothetical protein
LLEALDPMSEGKTLKEQNAWLIRATMIAHIAAFAWIALEPRKVLSSTAAELVNKLEAMALPGSASFGLIVIASLLLLGLIPSDLRDRLIHLRARHPLPGCRAFTEVGPKSSHVDMKALSTLSGPLPTDPVDQNALFYRIYKPLRDDVGVCDAHRRYLAARDIGTITLLLAVPLPIFAFVITNNAERSAVYGASLLATYFLCAIAAKNYSWRMVQHVLAITACQAPTADATGERAVSH